jgi:hypothetical protein
MGDLCTFGASEWEEENLMRETQKKSLIEMNQ